MTLEQTLVYVNSWQICVDSLECENRRKDFFVVVLMSSNHRENLACTLNLGNSNPTFLEGDGPNSRDRADSDSDIDDDDYLAVHPYQLLSDS